MFEERVSVGTIIGKYKHLENQSTRYLFLETAGVKTLEEAVEKGRVLSRLCELNDRCRKKIQSNLDSVFNPNS